MRVDRLGLALMKGARHERLDEVDLRVGGPVGDRELCLVDLGDPADPARQRVLRTVEHPTLLALRVRRVGTAVRVELPGGVVDGQAVPSGEVVSCDYWGRRPALELLDWAPVAAISEHVGRPVRLARAAAGDVVYGAPVTIVTTSELAELGARAGVPDLRCESARFRATVTLDDTDDPRALPPGVVLRLGAAVVELIGPIPRCAVIDLDPSTGRKDARLLETLAGYRRAAGEIWFGHYARVVSPGRCVAGDIVQRGA